MASNSSIIMNHNESIITISGLALFERHFKEEKETYGSLYQTFPDEMQLLHSSVNRNSEAERVIVEFASLNVVQIRVDSCF
jgi:hypothetical protein